MVREVVSDREHDLVPENGDSELTRFELGKKNYRFGLMPGCAKTPPEGPVPADGARMAQRRGDTGAGVVKPPVRSKCVLSETTIV